MGLFQSLQDLVGGASDLAQGSIQDIAGGLGEVPGVQEVQELTNGATDAVSNVAEQGQAAVNDIGQNLGL